MTFDDWFYDQFDRTREAAEAAWDYQQARINELEHKLALREAFIAGLQFGKQAAQEQE
jgi:hypothetical protein